MKLNRGFSLLELLIAIVIIAILVTIAYPSYNGYLAKGRRTQAMIDLLYMASQLESFYTQQNTYQGAPGLKTTTDDHSYQLVIQSTTESSYNLAAVPNSAQAALDQSCGTLTLNELGERGDSGTLTPEVCWH
jgi:type IV pilus assembly protein PilE